ncbi:hypothetical protein D3C80_966250 [compost metagenome]
MQGDVKHGLIVVILHLGIGQTLGLVVLDPFQQDLLLIGGGADDHLQPGYILGLADGRNLAVIADVKAEQIVAIAGKIEFFLAGFRDRDVRGDGVVFAGGETERPVGPGDGNKLQLKAKAVGDQLGDIRLHADRRFRVARIIHQRQTERHGRDRQLSVGDEFMSCGQKLDRLFHLFSAHPAFLFGRQVHFLRMRGRNECGGGGEKTAGEQGQ